MTDARRPANRLSQETSPYLLQHAHNPVDWYPWGPEALEKAKAEDKPILLSVGYSACHWCHVMERESFEDEATAADMNSGFVNIKVDREERPDLDEIYMQAVQAFTGGRGGWPMTVFLTPEGAPFFGGTYFPDAPRHDMPSFRQVLAHVRRLWAESRDQVGRTTDELVAYLRDAGRLPAPASDIAEDTLARIAKAMETEFDETHAGFGEAPKFPPHGTLEVLLAHAALSGDASAEAMALDTLDAMARGGMYDLLGGGFARYSVDAEWRIPHFEKMLYDNGQLVPVYLDAWRRTGAARYRRVVTETCDQVLREMQHPEGGLASAFDADSEGEEGRFYVFTPRDLREALGVVDGLALAALCEITDAGTFEHGTSVLRLEVARDDLAPEQQALLDRCFPALKAWRDQRTWPGRDDKVITAWNALMVSALARAGAALDEDRYIEAAERATEFMLQEMVVDGRLQRTWKDGRAHVPAFADDHAALTIALLDLFDATTDPFWLQEANGLATRTIALFWDDEGGGLFYTGHDAETLVSRSKRMLGGAEPSANGLAALAFARLAVLSGREELGAYADRIVRQ
ncbi:MAG: thioredoxin domain-containing protein, partial [Myxococcota bacterium]|nr:thioredoxin domain-containing protein [Myxococcota bacterium]